MTVGASFLNIQPFLHFHMHQAYSMIISIAESCLSCLLSLITAFWGQITLSGLRPIDSQHLVAKLHLKNR
jgi:hypothetical protein